ncbi:hypothetical protein KOW79_008793 [Hemibagrus wyckioides]|uniref:Uncharacterized protein n=1 Tax=Hemibagrus wyckioides TaxID=337641 RepID=A0A9D3SKB2_9TELE|nr:hypothetical protein KOW79_008793 [Hemibagrus wyckioides]
MEKWGEDEEEEDRLEVKMLMMMGRAYNERGESEEDEKVLKMHDDDDEEEEEEEEHKEKHFRLLFKEHGVCKNASSAHVFAQYGTQTRLMIQKPCCYHISHPIGGS